MRILLVEDSVTLRNSVAKALKATGYQVATAADGSEGLWLAENENFDAAVFDIMMPEIDGLTAIKRLRNAGNTLPILCLTARDTIEDRVKGLGTGADDYMVKPFDLQEFLARVNALCRRRHNRFGERLEAGDLTVDLQAKTVKRGDITIELAAREYALVEYLITRKGQVISRREIEEQIYDEIASPTSNVVDSAICQLRKKIHTYPDAPPLIHTRRGQGYVLELRPA